MHIKIFYKDSDQTRISYNPKGDWIDLYSAQDIELFPNDFALIDLGIIVELPEGHEAHIAPRGSTFKNWGTIQTNHIGIVDESYCGPDDWWKYPVLATRHTIIAKGDKICQFRIVKKMERIPIIEVDEVVGESRGGFGSTGTK